MMLVVSDVHHAVAAVRSLVARGEVLLILGDLVNLSDYRTGEGAIADVLGVQFALEVGEARARGDYEAMRRLWAAGAEGAGDDLRSAMEAAVARQYEEMSEALHGGRGYAIHGNVDRPELMREALPSGIEYVHGESRVIDGRVYGFAGGGVATPVGAAGEVPDAEMEGILDGLGPVDVLCTHVPPAIDALRMDAITGRSERGSVPILDYVRRHQPAVHLFGDVHQPQATTWRVGHTTCRNVGYFRATGRPWEI